MKQIRIGLVVIAFAVVALTEHGCSQAGQMPAAAPALQLIELHPASTTVGKVFNPQKDGLSAIAVRCKGATQKTVIIFDDKPLTTVFGSTELLTATVPNELLSPAREASVLLRDGSSESNRLKFSVLP